MKIKVPPRVSANPKLSRAGFTLIETLVAIAIIGLLIGLTVPAVQKIRGAAVRSQCANHLRQIGLGLGNYHSAQGKFPAGVIVPRGDDGSFDHMSWHTRLLPYVEQDAVWLQAVAAYQARPTPVWQGLPHPFATPIVLYGCPADSRTRLVGISRNDLPVAVTSYLGVSGIQTTKREGIFYRNSEIGYADITDGSSNTLMVGERPPSGDLWYGWWYAGYGSDGNGRGDMLLGVRDVAGGGVDPKLIACAPGPRNFQLGNVGNLCDSFHFWSMHSGGGHFLYADGSVHFLTYAADSVLPALATRAGGEAVASPD